MYILVVDDEPAVVTVMGRQIQKAGYNSVCLDDAEQAIKFFYQNQNDLDLAILDIHMPVMTGIEMAEEMYKMKSSLPVILVTDVFNCPNVDVANNIKKVLYKPVPRDELLNAIRNSLYA